MKRVVFITAILTHYRLPFHQRVREKLADTRIRYDLLHGQPKPDEAAKGDTGSLPWATLIQNRYLAGGRLTWQPALRHLRGADLVILGQENKLLLNYMLQCTPKRLRPGIALFGHGRNFQARDRNNISERWKRWWLLRCDRWFGYTEETRRHLLSCGFPAERITVFNNAVDTTALREQLRNVTPERLADHRRELGLTGENVAIYVGGLYEDKRLAFLVEAADRIRGAIADFELVIVGGGPAEGQVRALSAERPWIKIAGPRFGEDKVELMCLGSLFLMPGAVGLAILDAGVAGLPIVTTDFPYHGPEIAYLEDGITGLKVKDWRNAHAYADAVIELLKSPDRRSAMATAAREAAAAYTIEAMADRFVEGIKACCCTVPPNRPKVGQE